eukprot:CAMPEP_0202358782 /NCGR_PEP_ID=MMETSP1126-20121109/12326_1 /ASSEMBLY_ACC=CAM_ASM_000457 /TAXON_ID=3047 /ORGANISM="Dunaliella tertiolecta, Strain CCMP1320" /LENGTH=43 /DNA_ID= /DNA_START= /DNA_END= /DNA_ORIENTATION=
MTAGLWRFGQRQALDDGGLLMLHTSAPGQQNLFSSCAATASGQ